MFVDEVRAAFAPYAALSDEQLSHLETHYGLLTHWNKILNLTRIRSVGDAVRLHYCESLFVGYALPPGSWSVVDVGSGAGFPGIPFAVLRPECAVELVESHQRKAVFLREASRDLPNVKVTAGRADSVTRGRDWVIARAVRPGDVLSLGLAPRAALLMSSSDLHALPKPEQVFQLPWATQRILAMFHVKPAEISCNCST
jgi:16S rRNA G527 N7-methylase RsmG